MWRKSGGSNGSEIGSLIFLLGLAGGCVSGVLLIETEGESALGLEIEGAGESRR